MLFKQSVQISNEGVLDTIKAFIGKNKTHRLNRNKSFDERVKLLNSTITALPKSVNQGKVSCPSFTPYITVDGKLLTSEKAIFDAFKTLKGTLSRLTKAQSAYSKLVKSVQYVINTGEFDMLVFYKSVESLFEEKDTSNHVLAISKRTLGGMSFKMTTDASGKLGTPWAIDFTPMGKGIKVSKEPIDACSNQPQFIDLLTSIINDTKVVNRLFTEDSWQSYTFDLTKSQKPDVAELYQEWFNSFLIQLSDVFVEITDDVLDAVSAAIYWVAASSDKTIATESLQTVVSAEAEEMDTSKQDNEKEEETSKDAEDTVKDEEKDEVELTEPDKVIKSYKEYFNNLLGEEAKEFTLYTAEQVNRPLYCVSVNPKLNTLRPTPALSQQDVLPRVVGATSLLGVISGGDTILVDTPAYLLNNPVNVFTVYTIPFQYAVKPSTTYSQAVNYTDEYWLVQPDENTAPITPKAVAQLQLSYSQPQSDMNTGGNTLLLYLHVQNDVVYITPSQKLNPGYYLITVSGYQPNYDLKSANGIKVKSLTEEQYRQVTTYSTMLK